MEITQKKQKYKNFVFLKSLQGGNENGKIQ